MASSWTFAKRPFWIFSHLFVGLAVVGCLAASAWQFQRLQERREVNAEIFIALEAEPIELSALSAENLLEFTKVAGAVEVVDSNFISISGRTLNGVTGTHIVMLAQSADGTYMFINRGFWPRGELTPAKLSGTVSVSGLARESISKGLLDIEDVLDKDIAPRMDLDQLQKREAAPSGDYANRWIQAVGIDPQGDLVAVPEFLPVPEPDEGNHLSYAIQWLIFALLTVFFYRSILLRKAGRLRSDEIMAD